jgi:hypothetical protein
MRDAKPRDLVRRKRQEIVSLEFNFARDTRKEAGYRPQQCAFSRRVRADDAEELTHGEFERNAVQDLAAPIACMKVGDAQQG